MACIPCGPGGPEALEAAGVGQPPASAPNPAPENAVEFVRHLGLGCGVAAQQVQRGRQRCRGRLMAGEQEHQHLVADLLRGSGRPAPLGVGGLVASRPTRSSRPWPRPLRAEAGQHLPATTSCSSQCSR